MYVRVCVCVCVCVRVCVYNIGAWMSGCVGGLCLVVGVGAGVGVYGE